ncbi:Scavenger receptor class B [Mactra antiquata]
MKLCVNRRVCVSCTVGWILAFIGIIMIPVMPVIIKKIVQNTVVIHEGGKVYDYWKDPPVPIYLQIYMFNLTNQKEFLSGDKPTVEQIGPYTYSEKRVKFDIVWHDNGTVSYRQKRIFQFVPEMSKGNKETDQFLVPNPVYWALFSALRYEYSSVQTIISYLAALFDEHPFMYRPFKEVIWGYRDPMLNVTKAIDPEWFYTDIIGFFMNKNDTDDGVYNVFTGEKDIDQLGVIDRYNGTKYLKFWSTQWANMINGSDGTLGPPYLDKSRLMPTFSSDICRSVFGIFKSDVQTKQGINLWRFEAPKNYLANASVNPDNVGFCTPDAEHCLGAGLFNGTNCQSVDFFNLPIAFSMPHFLYGDPKYINAVNGIHPIEDQHKTTIDLEPYTGLVLQAAKRLQVNMYLQPIHDVEETAGITPVFYPVFWLNESASIDDKNADKLFSMLLTPLKIIHIGEIVLISVGALLILIAVIYIIYTMRSQQNFTAHFRDRETGREGPEETRPITQYDDNQSEYTDNQSTPVDTQSRSTGNQSEFQDPIGSLQSQERPFSSPVDFDTDVKQTEHLKPNDEFFPCKS